MLEKVTDEPGELASTSVGLPESREQVPLVTPGRLASFSGGKGASNHNMLEVSRARVSNCNRVRISGDVEWYEINSRSSQMDITKTTPLFNEALMVARPPLALNMLLSPKAVFCAAQKESVYHLSSVTNQWSCKLEIELQ